MKPLNRREFERVLRRFGWALDHMTGSHAIWRSPDGRIVTVAAHGGRPFRQGTQLAMIQQTGIPREEFLR